MDFEELGGRFKAWLRRKFSPDQRGEFQRGGRLVESGPWNKIKSGLFYAGCVLTAITFVFLSFFSYIPPDKYGVREVKWSIAGKKGIQNEKLETGYCFVLPIAVTLHLLPRHPIVLDYHGQAEKGEEHGSPRIVSFSQQHIQTSDGFYTDNDLSIMARIVNPYKTLVGAGPGDAFITNALQLKADNALKASLGLMDTEQYYQWPRLRYLLANGEPADFETYYQFYKGVYEKKLAQSSKEKPFSRGKEKNGRFAAHFGAGHQT